MNGAKPCFSRLQLVKEALRRFIDKSHHQRHYDFK